VSAVALGILAGGAPLATAASAAENPAFHPGAVDVGDPLTPGYGNGGYDVASYAIDVQWHPATGVLRGTTTIKARLTQNLSSFDLDFALPTKSVKVDGSAAEFELESGSGMAGKELVVTPKRGLQRGETMKVVVRYAAKPAEVRSFGYSNWSTTGTGVNVWNEPDAASQWWYPGNNTPRDKAIYRIAVTAPKRLSAITNGNFVSRKVSGHTATTRWRTEPMASYLSFLAIGRYDIVRDKRHGIPAYYAFERGGGVYVARARRDALKTPRIIAFLERYFGPYPFASTGAVVSRSPYGTAFESQSRAQYTSEYWRNRPSNVWAIVHETSHQWFGDNVTMTGWRHIWLAEGFATYAEWLWSGAHGQGTPAQQFRATYVSKPRNNEFWQAKVTNPPYALSNEAYERGAMTLQALRNTIGSKAFFRLLRKWNRVHRHGNGSTATFEALAEQVSGRDLDHLFRVWLHAKGRPAATKRNGFPKSMVGRASLLTSVDLPSAWIHRCSAKPLADPSQHAQRWRGEAPGAGWFGVPLQGGRG
jgi:aminopeptidase N